MRKMLGALAIVATALVLTFAPAPAVAASKDNGARNVDVSMTDFSSHRRWRHRYYRPYYGYRPWRYGYYPYYRPYPYYGYYRRPVIGFGFWW